MDALFTVEKSTFKAKTKKKKEKLKRALQQTWTQQTQIQTAPYSLFFKFIFLSFSSLLFDGF